MATHSSDHAQETHGQRSLVEHSPWDCRESDMTEGLTLSSLSLLAGCDSESPVLCPNPTQPSSPESPFPSASLPTASPLLQHLHPLNTFYLIHMCKILYVCQALFISWIKLSCDNFLKGKYLVSSSRLTRSEREARMI